jgi:hypothetical protein
MLRGERDQDREKRKNLQHPVFILNIILLPVLRSVLPPLYLTKVRGTFHQTDGYQRF